MDAARPEWAALIEDYSRHLPLDCAVCAMHMDTKSAKVYFTIDGSAMGGVKQHMRTRPRSEAGFLADMEPIALQMMRTGIGCLALVKHTVEKMAGMPRLSWNEIDFEGAKLSAYYYGAQMHVANALGVFMLLNAKEV